VPIDPKSLPQDPAILQRMLIDLTAQLDKTQKLLRQLLEAKRSTKSEQLSPDQLQLSIEELNRSKPLRKTMMSFRRRRPAPARPRPQKTAVHSRRA
jgi:hypothetical protein